MKNAASFAARILTAIAIAALIAFAQYWIWQQLNRSTDARQADTRVRLGDEKVRKVLLAHQGSCEELTSALFDLLAYPLF